MRAVGCFNDDAFGPGVQGCRDDFDFTQKFERIFFLVIPAAVFIAATLARIAVLAQKPRLVDGKILQYAKLVSQYWPMVGLLFDTDSDHRCRLRGPTAMPVGHHFRRDLSPSSRSCHWLDNSRLSRIYLRHSVVLPGT